MSLVNNIGFAAAACTTFSFIPQLTKIRKQGGRDLSYGMLSLYLLGLILWLAYGILLRATAVIAANAVSILLVVAAIVMKAMIAGPPDTTQQGAPPRGTSDSESENSRPIVIQS
jgi:MtN3 and saliva related transmembrane protein